MPNDLGEYNCQFTVDERKGIIAQMLREMRTAAKLSQKEVAALIQVRPGTYNTYETGRTEPPAEVLVRLSYLYRMPVDVLVARDRLYRTSKDLADLFEAAKTEIATLELLLLESGIYDPTLGAMKVVMNAMVEQMQKIATEPATQQLIDGVPGGGKD